MRERLGKIKAVIAAGADGFHGLNYLLRNSCHTGHQLDRRTRFEAAAQSPLLIDHRVDTSRLRIHHDHGSGMMTQRADGSLSNFQVLAHGAVLGDVVGHFIAHAFIDRPLASDGGGTCGLSPTTRFGECSPMRRFEPAHLSSQFALTQLASRASLQLRDVSRSLSGDSRIRGTQLTLGHPASAAPS
jgi:hypothetical protein